VAGCHGSLAETMSGVGPSTHGPQEQVRHRQAPLFDVRSRTAPASLAIRDKVDAWRAPTTRRHRHHPRLLNFWFHTHHQPGQRPQSSLPLLPAVRHGNADLTSTRSPRSAGKGADRDLRPPPGFEGFSQYERLRRYCARWPPAAARPRSRPGQAWQYFNAVAEARADFAKSCLRWRAQRIVFGAPPPDFEGGPHLPPGPDHPDGLRIFWDFPVLHGGEGERPARWAPCT